jgi:hypothetical protein
VQEVGPYQPVVESEALATGDVCGAVSGREPKAIMRHHPGSIEALPIKHVGRPE